MVIAAPMIPVGAMFVHVTDAYAFGELLLGVQAGVAGVGTIALIAGIHQNRKWQAWKARHPGPMDRLALAPSGWAGRESFGFVIAGRF